MQTQIIQDPDVREPEVREAEVRKSNLRALKNGIRQKRQLTLPGLAAAIAGCAALSLALAGCQSINGYSKSSLVRVIDASYNAPALNVYVEGSELAGNVGQGSISAYGGYAPSRSAAIKITGTTSTTALASTTATLTQSASQTVLISDVNAGYQLTVLEDQSTQATSGHSDFRFLNQAPSTGGIDIYFLAGTTSDDYADAKAVVTDLAAGASSGYISIPSSTLYLVIAPTGTTLSSTNTAIYTSSALDLTGGEVRTVLVLDPALSTKPVQVKIADDVD